MDKVKRFCAYCGENTTLLDENESCILCRPLVERHDYVKLCCPFCGHHHNSPIFTYCPKCKSLLKNVIKKGGNMNALPKAIVKLFPKTADAVIVDEYFHDAFNNNRIIEILAKGREKEILAAAHQLENDKIAKMHRK